MKKIFFLLINGFSQEWEHNIENLDLFVNYYKDKTIIIEALWGLHPNFTSCYGNRPKRLKIKGYNLRGYNKTDWWNMVKGVKASHKHQC